jgi:hypothetical protein
MKTLALACICLASPGCADSFWDHNGSLMRLKASGSTRSFVYETPRAGMAEQGVQPGTLLFDGKRTGSGYSGIARVFSRKCPAPMSYPMTGRVLGEKTVVLEGMRPIFVNCQPSGQMKFERLTFTYVASDSPPAVPGAAPTTIGPQRSEAAIRQLAVDMLARAYPDLTGAPARHAVREISYESLDSTSCGGPGEWRIQVVLPGAPALNRLPISADFALEDQSGQLTCATLAMSQ